MHNDTPEEKFAKSGSKFSTLNLYSTLNYQTGHEFYFIIDFQAAANHCNNIDDEVNFDIKSLKMPAAMSCEMYPGVKCKGVGNTGYFHIEGPVDVGDLGAKFGWKAGLRVESFRCRVLL